MLAFEVSVNGRRLCLVGTDMAVISVIVDWTNRHPDRISFHIGGLIQERQHARWNTPQLQIGDELSIRIVETDSADSPNEVYDPALDHGP